MYRFVIPLSGSNAMQDSGVQHLYVHVVHSNEAAVRLYTQKTGFAVENQETHEFANLASRPRRLLLHKALA